MYIKYNTNSVVKGMFIAYDLKLFLVAIGKIKAKKENPRNGKWGGAMVKNCEYSQHSFSMAIAEGTISLAEKSMNLPKTKSMPSSHSFRICLSGRYTISEREPHDQHKNKFAANLCCHKKHAATQISYKNQW